MVCRFSSKTEIEHGASLPMHAVVYSCKSLATSLVWPSSFDEVGIHADNIARSTLRRAPTAQVPGFTVTAVLTLALGVGATTAIFSCVYGLLLKSLPFQDASSIVALSETNPQVQNGIEATYPDYEDWKSQQSSFSQIAAYSTINPDTVSLVMDGHSEQVHRVIVSGNFFSLLGISPLIGRLINEQDDTPANDHVAVLSASAWDRYFGRDPGVLGRDVELNGAVYTVVGVLPPGAAYPTEGEVWLPLSLLDHDTRVSRIWHSVNVLGRLRPGIGLTSANADMQMVAVRLAAEYPATNRKLEWCFSSRCAKNSWGRCGQPLSAFWARSCWYC